MSLEKFPNPSEDQPIAAQQISDEMVLRFLQVLEQVREEDLSCSDLYARLDEFVEAEIREGKDTSKITPLIHEHLDMCSDCCDEYEALLSAVENTQDDIEDKKN
ncbi:MAG: hypothetical protein IPG80_06975 [Anaerolineales bacterium]|jgi:hypothetical protein|uniref:hypothetical protein n=1 Tax=Candidatus Villigracilis vicinus TaxID=3140679 RepID=UPI003136F049|nr:hypothetical protein [Anaerolineales bacterium]MBK7450075.1 hypothetical protein [Anaerolineales bacterium]MBK9782149.1 hypothetical protein [Anaerolineales bacterium]